METISAFVSSTWLDLEPERTAVEQLIQRFHRVRFSGMEYFGSRSEDTRTVSLLEVERSELYIGIFGHRYGSGITEAEYRRARERRLPCLLYFKAGDSRAHASDGAITLETLKTELRAAHTVTDFSSPSDLAAKLATDLHHWLFDRYITQGIAALSAPFAERIQSFLTEYTGTVDQPIPFGGRDADLERLTLWLADANGPPLLMLAAPAGRGKSALLVHWSRAAVANDEIAVVFFPISIRFNTNLAQAVFPALAARLASLHGEPLQAPPDATIDLWRSLLANYLGRPLPDGRRLLVIVDGIDEAADWEAGPDLFPRTLAPGTRIVVSARYLPDLDAPGWARRLGWDGPGQANAMTLDPLSAAGVADVLDHFGIELRILSSRVDVVAELHRLSGGDPLLVRLYVTALSAARGAASRLEPEDLSQIQPGLDGFFTRWWDDQRRLWGAMTPLREPAVQALLNVLACALGPLQRADLLQLSAARSQLNAWTLDDALKPISRFVIGNGVEQGYAFSHPRLGSYFYDRLAKAGQAREQEQRYIAWGRQVLAELKEHGITPRDVPLYLVQYFRAHLERMDGGVDALSELVSFEWLTAWSALDKGSFTGFLGDVRRIWLAAEKADAEAARTGNRAQFLDLEIRCALCLSSVISMAAEIPPAFLKALVQRDVWTPAQGLAYASNKPNPKLRVDALLAIATVVPPAQRDPLLGAALSAARTAGDEDERDRLLVRVSEWLDEPLAALRHVENRGLRLREVAAQAASRPARQVDVVVRALDDASDETDLRQRLILVQALGTHVPEPHRTRAADIASRTLQLLLDSGANITDVLDAATGIPAALVERCLDHLNQGLISERTIGFGRLIALTSGEAQNRVLAAGLEPIRSASSDVHRLEHLRGLLRAFPNDRLEAIDPILDLFESNNQRARARIAILGRAQGRRRDLLLLHLLDDLARWPDDQTRTLLLIEIAPQLSRAEAALLINLVAAQPALTRTTFLSHARLEEWPDIEGALEDLARASIGRQLDPIARARFACDLASHSYMASADDGLANRLFAVALDAVNHVADADQRAGLLVEFVPFAPGARRALVQAAQTLPDARWTIAIALEMYVCFAEGALPDPDILASAFQRLEGADAHAWGTFWTKRVIGVELGDEAESAIAIEPIEEQRHEVFRTVPIAPPRRERIAEIIQGLEVLTDDPSLSQAVDWIESVKSDVVLLPEELFQEVLDFFGNRTNVDAATMVCRTIADECVSPERRQLALASAVATLRPFGTDNVQRRFRMLLEIAPDLEPERQGRVLIEALRAAGGQPDTKVRDDVMGVVLSLPQPSPELVVFAIEDSLTKQSGVAWLRQLTARLPVQLVPRVLAAALLINPSFEDQSLRKILAAVPQPPWHAVFETVSEVPEELVKAPALVRLAGYADESLLSEIVDSLRQLKDPLVRARGLGQVVPLVGDALAERALAAGWAAMSGAAEDGTVIDLLMRGTVGATVHHTLLPAAVATVLTLLDEQLRARALETLAPHLSADLLEQALKGLQILRDDSQRTQTLAALLAALQETSDRAQVAEIAARTARGIPWADRRATRLAELALEAAEFEGDGLLLDAVAAIQRMPAASRTEPLIAIGAALASASEDAMAAALVLVEDLPARTSESGTISAPKAAVLTAMIPNLATPLLVKTFAIGGAHVASPLERIRLLTYLARDVDLWNDLQTSEIGPNDEMKRQLALTKRVEGAIGSNPGVIERLAMLLRDGPLAVDRRHLRMADLEPRFWPEQDREELLKRALEHAFSLGYVQGPLQLACLAPHLNADLAGSAVDALHSVGDEMTRAAALRRMAPFLAPELLPRALSLVRTLSDTHERTATLVRLLPLLPLPFPSGVLSRIRALPDHAERAWLLTTIALRTLGPRQESLVREALETARAIESAQDRSRFLTDVAIRLPSPLLHMAMDSVQVIADPELEACALIAMVPRLTGNDASRLVSAVTRLEDEEHRASVLYAVARFGCDELLPDTMRLTESVGNPFRRSLLLAALSPRLSPTLQPSAVTLAATIVNPSARVEALSSIAQHAPSPLPGHVAKDVCVDLRHVADDDYRSELARHVWRHLPSGDFALALDLVGGLHDENVRVDALRSLMDATPEEWRDGLKDLIGRLKDPRHRAVLLAELSSLASPLEKAIIREEALACAAQVPDRLGRAETLREMVSRLREPDSVLLEHSVRAVLTLRRPTYAADVIEHLASHFDEHLAAEVIDYARSVGDESVRVRIIASVSDKVGPSAIAQLLTEVGRLRGQVHRCDLLCALARCIADDLWAVAIDTAVTVLDESYQADVFVVFSQHMSEAALPLALGAAERIAKQEAKVKAVWGIEQMIGADSLEAKEQGEAVHTAEAPSPVASADLVELFAPLLSASIMQPKPAPVGKHRNSRTLARLRIMESELDRVATIVAVVGRLDDEEAIDMLQIIDELNAPSSRVAALQAMAPYAAPTVVPRIWRSLRRIPDTGLYASVLLPLALRLSTLDAAQAHEICADIIRVLAGGTRSTLVDGIRTLVPVIIALGHQREIVDTAVSINEVGTWWP